MNLIGKIFVVLVLIMSIVFMTVAVVVYATHRNWEDLAKQRQNQLRAVETERDAQIVEFNELKNKLEAQENVSRQQIAKLQSEQRLLLTRNTGIQGELDELKETRREAVAAIASTQRTSDRLADENSGLRTEIRDGQKKTDDAVAQSIAATEKVNNTVGSLETASERAAVLMADLARQRAVLEANNIDPATSVADVTPIVDGFVSAVRRDGGSRLIEVTIGSDDGLRVGHKIEVFRGRKYLGRATIRKTDPDQAVGVIDPNYGINRIQEGDRVATRLKLS